MYVPENAEFRITLRAYGDGVCSCTLIGDDGYSNDYKINGVDKITVTASGNSFTQTGSHPRYCIIGVERIGVKI